MSTMLKRTKSTLALGVAVVVVAVGSLAGAPTAAACPIDTDGNCLVSWDAVRIPNPLTKQKLPKLKKAPIRHSL